MVGGTGSHLGRRPFRGYARRGSGRPLGILPPERCRPSAACSATGEPTDVVPHVSIGKIASADDAAPALEITERRSETS